MSSSFRWDLPGLNQQRFRGYASLLRLQSGGQVDERFESEIELESEKDHIACEDDDSVVAQNVSSFDGTRLRHSFQDRVAELISNKKGGYNVAATLLIDSVDGVTLVVAKNESFSTADKEFLSKFQDLLRDVSRTSGKTPQHLISAASNT
jgi:hypothetical protein